MSQSVKIINGEVKILNVDARPNPGGQDTLSSNELRKINSNFKHAVSAVEKAIREIAKSQSTMLPDFMPDIRRVGANIQREKKKMDEIMRDLKDVEREIAAEEKATQ